MMWWVLNFEIQKIPKGANQVRATNFPSDENAEWIFDKGMFSEEKQEGKNVGPVHAV
jgi:hypothetical protein